MAHQHSGNITIFLCVLGFLSGCASPQAPVEERTPAVTESSYLVKRGDTLIAIAWRYGLNYRDIAKWNRLKSPDLIYAGQRLRLTPPEQNSHPVITDRAQSFQAKPQRRSTVKTTAKKTSPQIAKTSLIQTPGSSTREQVVNNGRWRWPTQGRVVHTYEPDVPGHKGIQISGQLGQPVRAASSGQVVYSGSGLPGYGRLIIVKHSDNLLSAYGYLGKILVKEGDSVQMGQSIAELGTSNENRPILHFEIRQNGKPVDPLRFLPG